MIRCRFGKSEFGCAAGAFGVFAAVGKSRAFAFRLCDTCLRCFDFALETGQRLGCVFCEAVSILAIFFEPGPLAV